MTSSDTVLSRLDAGVLCITLNRPDRLNAFTEEMHIALRAEFDRARDDDAVRAVLLTGAGRGFCAGQDLGDRDPRKGEARDLGQTLDMFYNPTLRLMREPSSGRASPSTRYLWPMAGCPGFGEETRAAPRSQKMPRL